MDQVRLDHNTTREQLREAFESRGVDISAFTKPFERIWKEYRNSDVASVWSDEFDAFIQIRYGISLTVHTPRGFYCEIGRKWHNKPEPDMNIVPEMVSGTQTRNETANETVLREARAELGLKIPLAELTQLNYLPEGTLRKSRINPRLMSLRFVTRFHWETSRRFRRSEIPDTGVDILLGRFPKIPQEAFDRYAAARQLYAEFMLTESSSRETIDEFKEIIRRADEKLLQAP